MKRYLLFTGDNYYPSGGWDDFVDSFDSLPDALAALGAHGRKMDWFHVVDSHTGKMEVCG